MTLVKHDRRTRLLKPTETFDRFFGDLPDLFRRPVLLWPERALDLVKVDEYTEGDALVIRADLPGIDPEKDVEISVEDGLLHVAAERREEEKTEERSYVRREIRYGSFTRDLPLPKGVSEGDVTACYKDGLLEIRVPMPSGEVVEAKKIPVSKA